MKNVLITGANGYIGTNLFYKCSESSLNSFVIDKSFDGISKVDIRDVSKLRSFFKKTKKQIDTIVHLAAVVDATDSLSMEEYYSNNIQGTLNMIQMANEFNVGHFILASSAAVYDESRAVNPSSLYGKTKAACENLCYDLLGKKDITSFRFFNVAGATQAGDKKMKGFISKAVNCIINKKQLIVNGDGTQTRDFIHVEDVCNTIVNTINNPIFIYGSYDLCTGISYSINEVIDAINKIYGEKPLKIKRCVDQNVGIKKSVGNVQPLLKNVYEPKNSLSDIIVSEIIYQEKVKTVQSKKS